jgi:xylulokinase
MNRLRDLGIRPKQIRLTGGGAANPLWRQILADVFDAEVIGVAVAEGAAYGAAIQAKWCHAIHRGERIRIQQITDAFVKPSAPTRCTPKKDRVRIYRELQELHGELSRANAPVFPRHAAL